ncbi:uncharacterized protein LOC128723829 [Anopheles nili]|uniref:uncharacterized protein LOC128723829 n=1 Tax=Anopheles nili TaxID=185578 RepID=UPI00237A88E1|nr:uncharacterized protein LOC128723829 [Anopheles nili]
MGWLEEEEKVAAFEDGGTLAIKAEPLDIPLKKPKLMSDVGALYHSGCGSGTSRSQHNATQLLVQAHHHAYHHQQQAQLQQQQTSAAFRPWTAQQKAQKYAQQQQQALLLQQIGPYANGTTTTIVNGTIRATSPGGSILTLSSQEPPLLQNPENVVPMSEKDKFERSYQPNVALVPRKSILCGKDSSSSSAGGQQRRDYDDKERSVIKCEVVQIKQESPPTPPTTSSSSSASGRCPSTGSAAMHEGSVMRSVIKCDVQIKQERPGTPPPPGSGQMEHGRRTGSATGGDSSRSPGPPPTSHIPVTSPPSGGGSLQHQGAITISTIIAKHHVSSMGGSAYGGGSNSNSPVPLDAQQHSGSSGSNEITSSTSPLPPAPIVVSMGTLNGACIGGDGTPGSGIDKPKLVLIKEPISPPVGARTASVRHSPHGHLLQQQQQQQQHGLAVSHHSQQGSSSSPPPPSHHGDHHQPLYMHHHQVLHQQQQQHHHYRSHHGGVAGTIIHRNGGLATVGNSEFELSTDTDDDSQAGEPDSSNAPSTVELIGEVLKEVEPETKQQILDIFKVLLQESRVEHHRLQMEIRAKEDQMVDVQRQKDHLQQQVHQLQHELDRALLKIDSLREHHHQLTAQQHHHHHHHHQQQQQHHIMIRDTLNGAGESSTSSTPPSPLSLVSNGSNSNHSHHQPIERRNSFPEKSEIIMKPLKKLLRRSPDDSTTVLMLASPPPQPPVSVTLPSTLPACLSITATSIPVAPKESFIQRDTDASSEDTVRRQRCSSAGSSTSPPLPSTVSQGGPLVPPSTPSLLPPPAQQQTPPTSATNVPASPTTITTVVSAVNDGAPATTTASSTSTTKSLEKEDPVTPPVSPNVVVIPVGGGPAAPSSEGTVASPSSPRPPSRVTSPESDRHENGATVASDHEDNVDEDEPMPEAPAAATSLAVDGESVSSPTGASSAVKSPTTDTVVNAPNKVTGTTSSAATTIVSNQDQKDSPSRTKGERTCDGSSSSSSGSNNTSTSNSTGGKSSCDN